jgi:beta-galactosidase
MRRPSIAAATCILLLFGLVRWARGNGEIFPAEPAAAHAIQWKDGYFQINGVPTFLTSGEMHYARIPRALWRDRIWRARQMGFNCMQMYVFWNATEGAEGHWDFSDNLDLDAWLSLLQQMGMYAVVRVGPYSCAEWEEGGIPSWLTIKPDMTLRDSDPLHDSEPIFEGFADDHLARVEKIVAKHQINHGGNVLMVQLENEHPRGWGTDDRDPYLKHLVDQARANGLEIPLFLSGLHHGGDPSGEAPYPPGPSPWYTTEFWTGWIAHYGDMDPAMLNEKIRGTWKIIAFGGAGYDYYMIHGGSNFGYSGNSTDATYDYSAPIGESGQFHNFYFPARRAAWFAQSFSSLLTGSHNDPDLARSDLPGLRVTSRTNPAGGSFILIDNFQRKVGARDLPEIAPDASAYHAPGADKSGALTTRVTVGGVALPHLGSLKVSPSEPRTILYNLPWTKNAFFESVCANVLLRHSIGGIDDWVLYGPAGDTGEVTLKRIAQGPPSAQVDFTYPAGDAVKEIDMDSFDGHQCKLLVMNTGLTNKTWLAHDKLYIGPSFVLEDDGMEFPPGGGHATIYSAAGRSERTQPPVAAPGLPVLSKWSWRDAASERLPDYSAAGWAESRGPQAMESYEGYENRYGWYRTVLHRDSAGIVALHFSGMSGAFAVFLNGRPSSFDHLEARAGDNTLSVLVKAGARPTLYNFTGPIGNLVARGLWGGVSTDQSPVRPAVTWKRWSNPGSPGNAADIANPNYNDSAWQSAPGKIQLDRKGTAWFRGTFNLTAGQVDSSLQASGFGGAGAAYYLNGRRLGSSSEEVSGLLVRGANTILVEVHPSGITRRLRGPPGTFTAGLRA